MRRINQLIFWHNNSLSRMNTVMRTMKTFSNILFNFFFSLLPVFVFSQTTETANTREWSLNDCISYGMEHNLALRIDLNNIEKEELNYHQAKWQFAPSVNGWSNGNMDLRRSTDQYNQISSGSSYSVSYGINAALTLFSGFTNLNQISAMKYNFLAYSEKTEQQKNLLYLEIVNSYALTVFSKQQVRIASDQLDLVIKEKEKIESKVEVGLLGTSSVDEINATLSGNRWNLDKQKNLYNQNLLSLTQRIDRPDTAEFSISGIEFDAVIPSPSDYTVEKVYTMACNNLPKLKEKEYRLQYYKKELRAAQGSLLPKLNIEGNYYSQFYSTDTITGGTMTPIGTQYNKYLNPSLSFNLSVPIFNKRNNDFQIRKSRIDIENALLELEQQKKEIYKEIQNAIQLLNASYLEYLNAADNLKYVEKSFSIFQEKYSLGLINSTDFITAQNQLLQAKTNILAAKYTWVIQDKTIRLYSGIREF
jgi:outer membrane protein